MMATKKPIVFGSPEAKEVLKKDISRGVVGDGIPGYGKPASRPLRDKNGELIDYGDDEDDGDEALGERPHEGLANGPEWDPRTWPTREQEAVIEQALSSLPESAKTHPRAVPTLLGVRWVPISSIRIDAGTQSRVKLDILVAVEYQTKFESHLVDGPESESSHARAWGDFPPLEAFFDEEYWLVDGYHRLSGIRGALERAGLNMAGVGKWLVPCRVYLGTRREAILYAAGANANHGLRRTSADKRRAVEMLLRDDEWRGWSDAEIGRRCAVDPKTVATVRKALEVTLEIPESVVRKAADGRTVNTEKIGDRPIAYAKVHTLETCVRQWLSIAIGEGGTPDPDTVLDMLKIQSGEPDKAGNWLSLVCQSLIEAEIVWRKSDLTQAINNVRDQRRQAKLQAASKKVYVEPKPEPEIVHTPEELAAVGVEIISSVHGWHYIWQESVKSRFHSSHYPSKAGVVAAARRHIKPHACPGFGEFAQRCETMLVQDEVLCDRCDDLRIVQSEDDELEAIALVAAEQVEEDAERAARDATRPSFENVPEPVVVKPPSILTHEWVIFVLSNYTPASSDFAVALSAATLDDLREAMCGFDQEEKHWRARLDAIKNRMTELMAPDPRIAEAQSLIALLTAARDGVRADYGRLCGKHLDALGFERDVETMIGRLASLVDILTGKEVGE